MCLDMSEWSVPRKMADASNFRLHGSSKTTKAVVVPGKMADISNSDLSKSDKAKHICN